MDVRTPPLSERLDRARVAISGDDGHVTHRCGSCGATTKLAFTDFDYRLAASLHAAMPGAAIDDTAAVAFERAAPPGPGIRALECACPACRARFRITCDGGEISRDGALEYFLFGIVEQASAPAP
jgi:hypothetical protein